MNAKKYITIITSILMAACTAQEKLLTDATLPQSSETAEVQEAEIEMTTEMVVFVSEDVSEGFAVQTRSSGSILQKEKVMIERLFPDAGEWEERHREAGLHRWFKVTFYSPVPVSSATEELNSTEGILEVEAPVRIKRCATSGKFPFNDPYGPKQWQYYNDGTILNGFVAGCDINVVPVWEKYTGGSSDVIVSVVDDGIYYNHPDLKGVVIPGGDNGSRNFYRNNGTIVGGDHGTHVAGLIGAVNNNGVGCSSVAGGLDGKGGVQLLSCQIFEDNPKDEDNPYTGNIANAIVWGADHGAVISQNSWGYGYSSESQARNGSISSSHKAAIDYFIKNAGIGADGQQTGPMKGGVVIFSAGNENWQYAQPASYDKVIAVGATGPDGKKATYSNYGDWVDICAPGGEYDRFPGSRGTSYILSLANTPDNYLYMCGTSMSCPIVSGVAALIISQFGGPGFTNDDLKDILLSTSNTSIIPASEKIGGMVDAYAAFTKLADKPSFSTAYTGNYMIATGEKLTIEYMVSEENSDTKSYKITMDSDGSAELNVLGSDRCAVNFISTEANIGSHKAKLTAETLTGKTGELVIEYTIYHNEPPVITFSQSGEKSLMWHEKLPVTITVKDPEGQAGTKSSIRLTPESAFTLKETEDGFELTVGKGDGAYSGECTVSISAEDIFGARSDTTMTYTILENRAPEVKSGINDIKLSKSGDKVTLDLSNVFVDPDGENLKFSSEVTDTKVAAISNSLSTFFVRASGDGYTDIIVKAKDGLGKECSASFKVGVYDDSKGPTLFPNPVSDYLTVRIGNEDNVSIDVFSEMGAKVLSMSGKASIFSPLVLDFTSLAPGRYTAKVTCGGTSYKKEIVRL